MQTFSPVVYPHPKQFTVVTTAFISSANDKLFSLLFGVGKIIDRKTTQMRGFIEGVSLGEWAFYNQIGFMVCKHRTATVQIWKCNN